MALAVAGFAKVFVGEIVEKGKIKYYLLAVNSVNEER
jgi:hypothetical protein